ncbi:YdgH/BhsA/McbA-like domain containing protein [Acerihabitans sp.]|uniref:YdgH/BhsA/McbA-like domain containing protein n=1 Tax=Acerihabitans sp. TaxID=2811394 RepID=UPI002EDA8A6F
MKIIPYIFTAIIAGLSFSSQATQEISQEQAAGHQRIGTVSVSGLEGSTDDATHALRQKARQENAPYYRIIGVDNPGDSSAWSGDAELYR